MTDGNRRLARGATLENGKHVYYIPCKKRGTLGFYSAVVRLCTLITLTKIVQFPFELSVALWRQKDLDFIYCSVRPPCKIWLYFLTYKSSYFLIIFMLIFLYIYYNLLVCTLKSSLVFFNYEFLYLFCLLWSEVLSSNLGTFHTTTTTPTYGWPETEVRVLHNYKQLVLQRLVWSSIYACMCAHLIRFFNSFANECNEPTNQLILRVFLQIFYIKIESISPRRTVSVLYLYYIIISLRGNYAQSGFTM